VIVAPYCNAAGHWFGGGNMVVAPTGELYLVGRYRNQGDSRLGVAAGERGLELAVFRSPDGGESFEKVLSFSKSQLSPQGQRVLSIEGAALSFAPQGVELFVSSEKADLPYPPEVREYLKHGAGVWTIDRLVAPSVAELPQAAVRPLVRSEDPRYLHVKDPFLYRTESGDTVLLFCSHSFGWTSNNSAYTIRKKGSDAFGPLVLDFFPRGATWDVAMTRATCVVRIPRVGAFAGLPPVSLVFYDGGECVRRLDEHERAVKRPRGYSCDELGGAAYFVGDDLHDIHRLSTLGPLFVSPWGTGSSRYVDVLPTERGLYVTWQQSQEDCSQPLVMNYLSMETVSEILA
jgi:hypothetical protein